MNNELYPSSFKTNQSSYRSSMPPCDCSTFKPPPIAHSNASSSGQLSGVTVELLKQQQQKLSQRKIVPNSNKFTTPGVQKSNSIHTSLNSSSSNENQVILNRKINLRSKSPPRPPQRFTSKQSVDQSDGSPLWRSKSFAGGLQQQQNLNDPQLNNDSSVNQVSKAKISLRQPPVTYANPSAAVNRNTIHLGKQLDDKTYGFNNFSRHAVPCNQNCCRKQQPDKVGNNNINKVNDEISQRYLAAAENNFNGLNRMCHSQSHHSYLASKAPNNQQTSINTGTLPNRNSVHVQPLAKQGSLDASSLSSIGSSNSGSLTRNSAFLSQKYPSVGNLSQTRRFFGALSLGGAKNSRNPQPQRSLLIFASIEKGLRECICLTQEDISQLKNAISNGAQLSSAQGKLYELERQYKNAERYLKRLEFQLAKIEELHDQYEMHMKMSDGVRSMTTAYILSPGKEKEVALNTVRNELKEYTQTMGIVEQELEQSMGSFLLQMQGIQGFARLCAGDVFEITIKCGEKQKWKCKGKILKDNVQSWDSTEQIFRPNLTEQLSIKAVELRGLGKKLCLGSKNCEIKDLFSARPQLMSICLNTTGTLKLHLIVTWNPLHEPKTSALHGALSASMQSNQALTGGNTTLTKSKSFTASSTSLFSKFRNHSGNSTNTSSTYSTLNLSNNLNNNALFNRTLNKRCTLPSGFEIIDADYYHHPHLIAEANRQEQLNKRITMHAGLPTKPVNPLNNSNINPVSRMNSGLISSNLNNNKHNRHSYAAGFNHTSLSPIHSPNLRTEEEDEANQYDCNQNNQNKKVVLNDKKVEKCQIKQQQHHQQQTNNNLTSLTSNVDGITPTSTGSRGSSLHLTGTTTSSGFGSSGSSSSYCSSSVPNSALTSPDSELAPCESTTKDKSTNHKTTRSVSDNCSISTNSSPIQSDIYDSNGHSVSNNNEQFKNRQIDNKKSSNLNHNRNSIIVEATVHQNPESNSSEASKSKAIVPRSTSMPVQLSAANQQQQINLQNSDQNLNSVNNLKQTANRTESMDTLTTPDVAYQPTYFNVGDTLINLMSSLEDVQGQFSELTSLQENVVNLYKVLCQVSKLRILNTNLQNIQQHYLSNGGQPRVRRASDASNISVSVESALECFDFLNQAGTDSEVDSVACTPEHRQAKLELIKNQQQQAVTNGTRDNDSALSTPCPTPSPSLQSTRQLSTGCDQIDIALMSHLIYCQRLIESLGSFGPLKSREQSSLAKLQLQAQAIERLVRVCIHLRDYLQVCIELRKDARLKQYPMDQAVELENLYAQFKQQQDLELSNCFANDPRIAKLWDFVCYLHTIDHEEEKLNSQFTQTDPTNDKQKISLGNTLLCCTSAGFALCLEKFMQINNLVPTSTSNNTTLGQLSMSMSNLTGLGSSSYSANKKLKGNELSAKISELITKRLIDAPKFESDFVVSLFQLCIYFQSENSSLEHLFRLYAQEVQLLNSLQSSDAIEIEQSLKPFKRTLPPKEPLLNISLLLLESDELIVRIAEAYFLNASKNRSIRAAILTQLLDALQNDNANLRQAACLAMTLLNGSEYLNHLVFICSVDSSIEVRNQAKQTLLSFGKEGQQLYLDSQRFNHGFQGLIVK